MTLSLPAFGQPMSQSRRKRDCALADPGFANSVVRGDFRELQPQVLTRSVVFSPQLYDAHFCLDVRRFGR